MKPLFPLLCLLALAGCEQEYDVPKLQAHYLDQIKDIHQSLREVCSHHSKLRSEFYAVKRELNTLKAKQEGRTWIESVDDLPEPDGPMIATTSPL